MPSRQTLTSTLNGDPIRNSKAIVNAFTSIETSGVLDTKDQAAVSQFIRGASTRLALERQYGTSIHDSLYVKDEQKLINSVTAGLAVAFGQGEESALFQEALETLELIGLKGIQDENGYGHKILTIFDRSLDRLFSTVSPDQSDLQRKELLVELSLSLEWDYNLDSYDRLHKGVAFLKDNPQFANEKSVKKLLEISKGLSGEGLFSDLPSFQIEPGTYAGLLEAVDDLLAPSPGKKTRISSLAFEIVLENMRQDVLREPNTSAT